MTKIRLPFIKEYRDRHGKVRRYFRKRGLPLVQLPGLPGSEEFMAAYHAALGGGETPKAPPERVGVGSVDAAVTAYLLSATFEALALDTRRTRRNILDRWRERWGKEPIGNLEPRHVQAMVNAKARTPFMARNFLKALRGLMAHCLTIGLIESDPTEGVTRPKAKTAGYATWTEDDIAAFEKRHPHGSRARLALALFLYTAQRKADVVKLGRQHRRNGFIRIRQQKTGADLMIPEHPALAAELDAIEHSHLTFLVTAQGKPFTPNGFGNWFREVCNDAGLPLGISAHGLRKAACRRLAEAGCSEKEIASISGHATLSEVARYTKAADQARLARAAMDRVANAEVSHLDPRSVSPTRKPLKTKTAE